MARVVFTLIAHRAESEAAALAFGDSMASYFGEDAQVLSARWNGADWLVDLQTEEDPPT